MFTGKPTQTKWGLFMKFPKGISREDKTALFKAWKQECYEYKAFGTESEAKTHLASLDNAPMQVNEFCHI